MWNLVMTWKFPAQWCAAKKRSERSGGNLHTGKWHAGCRNESYAHA